MASTNAVLVRAGDRYGLRVPNSEAEATHKAYRPDQVFLPGGDLKKYRVGPMLYGATKASVMTVISKWGWPRAQWVPLANPEIEAEQCGPYKRLRPLPIWCGN